LLFCIFINSRHHTQREKRPFSPQTQEKCQKPLVRRNIMLLEVVGNLLAKKPARPIAKQSFRFR